MPEFFKKDEPKRSVFFEEFMLKHKDTLAGSSKEDIKAIQSLLDKFYETVLNGDSAIKFETAMSMAMELQNKELTDFVYSKQDMSSLAERVGDGHYREARDMTYVWAAERGWPEDAAEKFFDDIYKPVLRNLYIVPELKISEPDIASLKVEVDKAAKNSGFVGSASIADEYIDYMQANMKPQHRM